MTAPLHVLRDNFGFASLRPGRAKLWRAKPRRAKRGLLCVFFVMTAALATPPALAQDSDLGSLIERVDRLQRELITLQRSVYKGEPAPEPAPGVGGEGMTTTAAARIELRLSQFESELRALTGRMEEVSYRQGQISERLDRLAADIDLRLQQLEGRAAGMAAAPGAGAAAASGAAASTAQPPAGGAAAADGAPKTLGTVAPEDIEAVQSGSAQAASSAAGGGDQTAALQYPLAGGTPEEQYNNAFALLSQANYAEAELALRAFVTQYPEHPLAGNAKYWLGETYYVRQDYQQAAITFAEGYQSYPDNPKAPDNLLKLGMSLASLGSADDACGTYAELLRRYPDSAPTIQQRAKQERQRLACP